MSIFMESIYEKARSNPKNVVLPEGDDERTIEAAVKATQMGIAKISMIGTPDRMKQIAKDRNFSLNGIEIIDINNLPDVDNYVNEFYELRKSRGKDITHEEAEKIMKKDVYYGAMMVRKGIVDTFVAGAVNTTSDVSRAAIYLIGMKEGIKTLSSFFVMILPDKSFGKDGILFYSDGGFVIEPDPDQLSDIAVTTGATYRELMGEEPKIAMLSFSTKGSAKHPRIDKVLKALELAKQKDPTLIIDGELQGDAALVPSVGAKKAPGSPVAGKATVLIFPDLDSGNIAYKLTERLAKAEAYGPIYQGTKRPCSDLSRGCKATDILNVVAINVVRLANIK
ncbi:MAG: phosphate acetyltransferase [Candidatus Goldbacteria bacterium]|nr:phosphate acetyltransferase [Candidatus Goldiibacteriota bacterium]